MKLYLISQTENEGYDTYDSVVVVAKCKEDSRLILPGWYDEFDGEWHETNWGDREWASCPENVASKYIGESRFDERAGTVICASFNAG